MIQDERLGVLRPGAARAGGYVLYWMQAAVRARGNHALEYAVRQANGRGLPLVVVFGLTPGYPGANSRHYRFLLDGLQDAAEGLTRRGIAFVAAQVGAKGPAEAALALAAHAALLVTDRGYLRHLRAWRGWLAGQLAEHHPDLPFIQVEGEAVVPVAATSDKQEYAARTIRPKLHRYLKTFLVPLEEHALKRQTAPALPRSLRPLDLTEPERLMGRLKLQQVPAADDRGGHTVAAGRLRDFLKRLDRYPTDRNDPTLDGASRLSAHLHFGHISPVEIALAVQAQGGEGAAAYLEELVVRRELSLNLCEYQPHYDTFQVVPHWAQATLEEHRHDRREHTYSPAQLEAAQTHDAAWNAAQNQMVRSGRMHNHMRMYWGKKVLEWTPDPAQAHRRLVTLNDSYELDGRDPNSYAGIGWVFGLHDRPWARRPIFGTVRYMAESGLRRKFDLDAYIRAWGRPEEDRGPG